MVNYQDTRHLISLHVDRGKWGKRHSPTNKSYWLTGSGPNGYDDTCNYEINQDPILRLHQRSALMEVSKARLHVLRRENSSSATSMGFIPYANEDRKSPGTRDDTYCNYMLSTDSLTEHILTRRKKDNR